MSAIMQKAQAAAVAAATAAQQQHTQTSPKSSHNSGNEKFSQLCVYCNQVWPVIENESKSFKLKICWSNDFYFKLLLKLPKKIVQNRKNWGALFDNHPLPPKISLKFLPPLDCQFKSKHPLLSFQHRNHEFSTVPYSPDLRQWSLKTELSASFGFLVTEIFCIPYVSSFRLP